MIVITISGRCVSHRHVDIHQNSVHHKSNHPDDHVRHMHCLAALVPFNQKKSAIWIAIIGANTEPIRYRKSVILSIGYTIAATVPITVTTMATCFPFHLLKQSQLEIPAEYASRNVVVTVENTMIRSPAMPRPAFTMICAISYSPVYDRSSHSDHIHPAADDPYATALTAVAFTGSFASLV